MPLVRGPDGHTFVVQDSNCTRLQPQLVAPAKAHLNYTAQRCVLNIYVTHDRRRVFVEDESYVAREADDVEIEALWERFRLPELRQALDQRRGNGE